MPYHPHRYTNMRGKCRVAGSNSGGTFRSRLERDGVIHWLLRWDVFCARLQQPCVKLAPKGRYTADLYVTFVPSARRRPLVIEYKYQSDLDDDPDLRLKHENLCPVFAQRGEDFEVHTERLVFTPDLNAKKLIWARCNDPASAFDERIVAAVEQRPGVAVGDILAELSNSQEQLRCVPAVWRLVAHRRIFIDFTRQPNRDTALWPEPLPSVRGIAP